MSSLISNALSRIKNAQISKKDIVEVPYSNFLYRFVSLLKDNGYVLEVERLGEGSEAKISIGLGYEEGGVGLIKDLVRISKSARRVYVKCGEIPKYFSGYATVFLSTSKGILVDKDAIKNNLGGELFCYVL